MARLRAAASRRASGQRTAVAAATVRHERCRPTPTLPVEESEAGLRINESAAAYHMAIAGQGVALGRTILVEDDVGERRVMRPCGPVIECSLAYHVVCRPQDMDEPTIMMFREWLAAEAG